MNKRIYNNCFTFIKLIAAFEVFIGHSYEAFGVNMPIAMHTIWFMFRGVPIFFIISGFLNWNSMKLKKFTFVQFVKRRIVRLYPELWIAVILNAVIIVVLMGLKILVPAFFAFNIAQATLFQFWTPDILREYGCGTPNGSLWTVGVMVQCFVIIWLLNVATKKKKVFLIGTLFVSMFVNVCTSKIEVLLPDILYKLLMQTFIPYIWLFIFGILICEYFDTAIEIIKRIMWQLLGVLVILGILNFEKGYGQYGIVHSIVLGLVIFGIAYRYPKLKLNVDVSYSFYLVHMVVINAVVHTKIISGYLAMICSFVISLVLSYCLTIIMSNLKNKYYAKSRRMED